MTKKRELTQEERQMILEKTPSYIQKCGVENYEKAKYISLISNEVLKSKQSLFLPMQPKIKDHHEDSEWMMAYSIVLNFLKDNNCQETLNVIKYEMNSVGHSINSLPDYEGNYEDFEKLLDYIPTKTEADFAYRFENIFVRKFPFLFDFEEEEEEFFEENIDQSNGAFLTQPTMIKQDEGIIDIGELNEEDEEEDEGEIFSINDINTDEVEDSNIE